jgi:cytochrome c oxidase assembly factor CtaG
MRTALAAALLAIGTLPAAAHDGEPHASAFPWTFDPWIVTPIAVAGGLYALGSVKIRQRAQRPLSVINSGILYWAGWLSLVSALVSPLHFLGEHLFTFHMIEHELVMAVAAPLVVLARPVGMFLWSLPRPLRHLVRDVMKTGLVWRTWNALSAGTPATLLHGLAIWAWHAPVLFDATVTDILLHRLQHLSFFVTAVMFWWAMIWRSDRGMAAWHLFLTMLHTSILGALIALSPQVAYVSQTRMAREWGLTPLEDQQLAGLVMWVPGGIIYAGAALAMLALWIAGSNRGGLDASRVHS